MASAHAIIIGNEILSGKFADENGPWLIRRCRELGLDLTRVAILSDDMDEIAQEVARSSARADHVFTTGGVGPTHDDVTMDAIARAFDVELVRDPELAALLSSRKDHEVNEAMLRMANVPKGAELWWDGRVRWPLVVMRNVLIFPGVPSLLRMKFDAIAHRLRGDTVQTRRLVTTEPETAIADCLTAAQARWPRVQIGCYPQFETRPWTATVILDSRDPQALDECHTHLRGELAGLLEEAE